MQSTNIIAYRKQGYFTIPIIGRTNSFAIKFDTGAIESVVSIETITGTLSDIQRKAVKQYISDKNIAPKEFKSASGHPFYAYPSYMSNIVIGECMFDKFFYYLVVDKLHKKRKIALLGDNFIDCCGFAKEPHGDIVISKFDFSSYHTDNNALSTDEIMSIT